MKKKHYLLFIVLLLMPITTALADNCIEAPGRLQDYESYPHFQQITKEIHQKTTDLLSRYPDRALILTKDSDDWLNQKNKICSPTLKLADIDLLKNAILLFERRKALLETANAMPDFKISHDKYPEYELDHFGRGGEGAKYYPLSIVTYAKSFLYNFSLNEKLRSGYSDGIRAATLKTLVESTNVYIDHPYNCNDVWESRMVVHKYVVDSKYFDKTGNAISKKAADAICGREF